jgi:hypothetical protein
MLMTPSLSRSAKNETRTLRADDLSKERRLALLLADGSGNFDYVRAFASENVVHLQGHVASYGLKREAGELARHVGFTRVNNAIRILPA